MLARDPAAQVSLDNPKGVADLLRALGAAGASDAVTTLAGRGAAQVSLDKPWSVALLLEVLRRAGDREGVTTLADRGANAGMFDRFLAEIGTDEASSRYPFGREPGGIASEAWNWLEPPRLRPDRT